jgi:Secretion system C-terminal sorting domain
MTKTLLLLAMPLAYCLTGLTQLSSQTKTATFLNNLGQFQQVYGDQNYPRTSAGDVAEDDNIYASSIKLTAIRDSASSFRSRSVAVLALQGFGFSIPGDASIQNISVRVKRFKTGRSDVGDYFLSVIQRFEPGGAGLPSRYGKHWTYLDTYDGKIYPDIETEYIYSQSGSGTDGGFNHNETYQWTPAIVNAETFGVRIDNYPSIGKGSVVIHYDLVEITVQYSVSTASPSYLENTTQANVLKAPVVYPNPFTTKTNIQFTAAENGYAVVEIYTILGTKIRTVFSGKVVQGQVYNVNAADGQLSKGLYLYRITNGKQKYTGKILKIQ